MEVVDFSSGTHLLNTSTNFKDCSHINTFKKRSSGRAKFDCIKIDLCAHYDGNIHHPIFKKVFFYNLNHIFNDVSVPDCLGSIFPKLSF